MLEDFNNTITEYSSLIAAFFVLLASSVASATVSKSIKSNELIKNKEFYEEKKERLIFMISVCGYIIERFPNDEHSNTYQNTISREKNVLIEKLNLSNKFWDKLLDQKYISCLSENELKYYKTISTRLAQLNIMINHFEEDKDQNGEKIDNSYSMVHGELYPGLANQVYANNTSLKALLENKLEKMNI